MLHIMGRILAFAANSRDHPVIARLYHHKRPFFRLDGARNLSHALDMVGLFCVSRRVFNLRVVGPDGVRDVPDFLVTLRRGPMLYNRLLEAPDQAALGGIEVGHPRRFKPCHLSSRRNCIAHTTTALRVKR